MSEKIYILLPTYNRLEITQAFIKCLKSQTYQNYHLLLIDDGSTDGTEEMVESQNLPSLTLIKGRGDWWWAGSLQQGINWIKSHQIEPNDIVLAINDDVSFAPDFLANAVAILGEKKGLLLARGFDKQSGQLTSIGVKADLKKLTFTSTTEDINCFPTRGLFMRVAELYEIGNFYPKLLPHYLSDYEFTIRAAKKGLSLYTDPRLELWFNSDSTGYRDIEAVTFSKFFKMYFSKKSPVNPIYLTNFIILTSPKLSIIPNIFKVWYGAMKKTIKYAAMGGVNRDLERSN